MELRVFKALWGMTEPQPEALARIAAAGYAGVELLVPPWPPMDPDAQRAAVLASGLPVIPVIISGSADRDAYRRAVDHALTYRPQHHITSHTALDAMEHGEAVDFLGWALELEAEIGVPIGHETHRQHLFFTPWQTAALLRELPALKLVADYSHWVNVAERLLEDRADDMALANRHAIHIHARVGHPEGPQVNDPRAPSNAAAVAAHEAWWREIIRNRAAAGAAVMTITPEYGPPPYMPTVPFTDEPVADLWAVCLWGAGRVRELFAEVTAEPVGS
jgi:sugar phosphate isomerase/epimerase